MIKILAWVNDNGIMFMTGNIFLLCAMNTNSIGKMLVIGFVLATIGNVAESYLIKNHYLKNDLQD